MQSMVVGTVVVRFSEVALGHQPLKAGTWTGVDFGVGVFWRRRWWLLHTAGGVDAVRGR